MPQLGEKLHSDLAACLALPEREPALRHRFALAAMPRDIVRHEGCHAALAALEPGQFIAIELRPDRDGQIQAGASLPGELDCESAHLLATTLWPELDLQPQHDAASASTADLIPLAPRARTIAERPDARASTTVGLPVDPGLWPWRLNQAMRLLAACGAEMRISLTSPWSDEQTLRRIEAMARDAQIAQLQQPGSPLVEHSLGLIAWLRHEPRPVELLVECSASLTDGQRALLALLLFGEPAAEAASRCGILTVARRVPALLFPADHATQIRGSGQLVNTNEAGGLTLASSALGLPVALRHADRMRHMHILGGTGTGKSTLMRRLILQDIAAGEGVILIDPHGDLAAEVVSAMPAQRQSDLILADAAQGGLSLSLVPCAADGLAFERSADALVSLFMDALYGFNKEAFGPIFEQYFRNALLLLAHAPAPDRRLNNLSRVFESPEFRRDLLALCADHACKSFWLRTAARTEGDWGLANMTAYVTSKLSRLIGSPSARAIFSSSRPDLDLDQVLDGGGVLIAPCPKGDLGDGLSRLVMAALLMRLRIAAMGRTGRTDRRPVRIYIDEFQGARGSELALLLAEGRKYGLSLTLANQSISQLGGVDPGSLGAAVLANAGNLALFRLGGPDAQLLAPWLGGEAKWQELCRQGDFRFTARLLAGGQPRIHAALRLPAEGAAA